VWFEGEVHPHLEGLELVNCALSLRCKFEWVIDIRTIHDDSLL